MRVAIFEPKFLTPRPYAVSYLVTVSNIARGLSMLGHDVFVLAEGDSHVKLADNYHILPLGGSHARFGGILSDTSTSLPSFAPLYSPRVFFKALDLLRNEIRPEVIYTVGTPLAGVVSSLLQQRSGIPAVHHVCLVPTGKWWQASSLDGYRSSLRHRIVQTAKDAVQELARPQFAVKWGLNSVSSLMASSSYVESFLHVNGFTQRVLRIVYPGVDVPPALPEVASEEPFIAYFGHLYQGRGVLDLVEAFSLIAGRFPKVKLMVALTDINKPTEYLFRRMVSRNGLDQRIIRKGIVNNLQLEILAPALAVVLPYRSFPSIKLLETMAAGRPVVTTKLEWVPEIISDGVNGFMVDPGDKEEIARKLAILIENPNLAQQIGRKARETSLEKFSNEKSSRAVLEVLQSAAGSGLQRTIPERVK